jgi:glycosyltransferase involved in cell wall biosynthesis
VDRLEREAAVRTVTAWVRQAHVPPTLLVSIVLPTRNRADHLQRALESVAAQVYERWEVIVADDGSTDHTRDVLGAWTDPRVKVVTSAGSGAPAARNTALTAATGDVVVYLDDDNTLDPLWCKAVVWAFLQHPDVDVLYGARLMDDIDRIVKVGSGALPTMHFLPFDRTSLEAGNLADIGVIAHRAGLPEAWFDSDLVTHADWDLLLRLTERESPLELPVVACYYTSDAPARLSDLDHDSEHLVRQKQAARSWLSDVAMVGPPRRRGTSPAGGDEFCLQ